MNKNSAKSAAAKGLPKWTIPGIVQALKGSYSSLDSSTQTQVQGYVNDPDLSINQLIKKLGKITDTLSSSQQVSRLIKHFKLNRYV